MLKVYGDLRSGNCYKVKLLMYLLDIEHEWIHVDILNAETYTEEFKAINPNAKIPALVMTRGDCLWESNAILNYLADGTDYLPSKKFVRSQVLQWQFFEQYSHEPFIAVARYLKVYLDLPEDKQDEYESKLAGGYKALDVMENHLSEHQYFVADRYSIADISLYAYTHVAEEGGFDLSEYPAIKRWMALIESKLKHQTMQDFIYADERSKRAAQRLKEAVEELKKAESGLNDALSEPSFAVTSPETSTVKSPVEAIRTEDQGPDDIASDEDDPVDPVEPDTVDPEQMPVDATEDKASDADERADEPTIYDFFISAIEGHELPLVNHKNEVLLLVNVASECGLTPQYEALQDLQQRYQSLGFSVIGLPCNQFGAQEPGAEREIKKFCERQFKVTFPMTSKIEVNGIRRHPLYDYLAGENARFPGDISWNFEKFLIGKDGRVVQRFSPKTEPLDSDLIKALEDALEA